MAFEKLRELRCFQQMHDKVCAGIPIHNIAAWIQDEEGEYLETKREGLVRMLFRYKASLPVTQVTKVVPTHLEQRLEKLKRGISEVEELEKLYLLQMSRLNMGIGLEDRLGILNSKLHKDVSLALEILRRSVNIKMELGLLRRVPAEVSLSGTLVHEHQAALEKIDPDKRRKLGTVAAKLLEAVTSSQGEELDYEVVSGAALEENEGLAAAADDFEAKTADMPPLSPDLTGNVLVSAPDTTT